MSKILVIEDQASLLEEIIEWLSFEGFETAFASNGQGGLEKAETFLPDLIISDISMPEMNGYELLAAIQKNPKLASIPFIFLTAHADKASMRLGMNLGADDYLTKPFTRVELLSAIQTRLQKHKSMREESRQEVEDLKRKLIRVVSHELKTPLVTISFFQDIIERQIQHLSRGEITDLLQTLKGGTDRLQHLVNQVVTLSQIESGALSAAVIRETGAPVYLGQLVPNAANEARRYAYRNRHGDIRVDIRDVDAAVLGRSVLLKQVITELLVNALNFSPDNTLITLIHWYDKGNIWLTIQDEGKGMANPDVNKAQQPFEQIEREHHEQQGIGLGLTVSKQVVELHGGSLMIYSEVGKGTQVSISFPLYSEQPSGD